MYVRNHINHFLLFIAQPSITTKCEMDTCKTVDLLHTKMSLPAGGDHIYVKPQSR